MGHESGAAMPVRDRNNNERIYIFHWSGAKGDKWGNLKGCNSGNQLHFARIENGKLASELNKVTDNKGPHSSTYRNTPAVAAHPNGGAIVVFNECKSRNIYMTFIGSQSATFLKKQKIGHNKHPKYQVSLKDDSKGSLTIKKNNESGTTVGSNYELDGAQVPLK